MIGTLFPANKEPAFASLKMCQSLSSFTLFASGPYVCARVKIIGVAVVLTAALVGYVTLEVSLKMESKRNKFCSAINGQPFMEIIVECPPVEDRQDPAFGSPLKESAAVDRPVNGSPAVSDDAVVASEQFS